jgi:glycosyltransferase involved in cell wall biosynthesis
MEAMAMRLPVVSTRITGVPELVEDGHTGLLVAPGRPDVLADALERLLGDPSLCRELGERAREKVIREFNTENSAKQLYALFVNQLSPSDRDQILDVANDGA